MDFRELIKKEKYQDYTLDMRFYWEFAGVQLEKELGEGFESVIETLQPFSIADEEYCYEGDIAGFLEYIKSYDVWECQLDILEEKQIIIDDENKTITVTVSEYNPESPPGCSTRYKDRPLITEEEWDEIRSGEFGRFKE